MTQYINCYSHDPKYFERTRLILQVFYTFTLSIDLLRSKKINNFSPPTRPYKPIRPFFGTQKPDSTSVQLRRQPCSLPVIITVRDPRARSKPIIISRWDDNITGGSRRSAKTMRAWCTLKFTLRHIMRARRSRNDICRKSAGARHRTQAPSVRDSSMERPGSWAARRSMKRARNNSNYPNERTSATRVQLGFKSSGCACGRMCEL